MRSVPPGWATDLAILELRGSTVEDRGDHLVVRTLDNPGYHWGNCLLVLDPDHLDDAARWVDTFGSAFPAADWVAIGLPTLPPDAAAWSSLGVELEAVDVLTTTTMPRTTPIPTGYTVRALTAADWDQVVRRELDENARTSEHEPEGFERFVRAEAQARRGLCDRGLAAFFGAVVEGRLVADLGIVQCGRIARFQAVGTDEEHRRRGLASHLIGVAASWAAERGCSTWVIVTEATNDAGRVYRGAGFTLDDASVTAYRRPALR